MRPGLRKQDRASLIAGSVAADRAGWVRVRAELERRAIQAAPVDTLPLLSG